MTYLDKLIAADAATSGLPVRDLVDALREDPAIAGNRLDYPYIAGYATQALKGLAVDQFPRAPLWPALKTALLICSDATFRGLHSAASADDQPDPDEHDEDQGDDVPDVDAAVAWGGVDLSEPWMAGS